jgi:hypothetical protein
VERKNHPDRAGARSKQQDSRPRGAKHLISIVITVNEMADASIHSAPRALRGRRA